MSATATVLITGATSGIGYATAHRFLAEGAHVLVHGPTIREAERAMLNLIADGADPAAVWPVAADFHHLDEVTALAQAVSARHGRLDVLINNAATAAPQGRQVTDDGHERTFQVNYLAPFLLTRLLTPLLRASHGRMVALSSSLHRTGNINWGDPQRTRHYAPVPAYAQSKLALTMFTRALGEQHTDLSAISVHPGVVRGGLLPIYSRTGAGTEGAAEVLVRLSWPHTQVHNGAYYDGLTVAQPAALAANPDAVMRLWKLTIRLLGHDRFVSGKAA